MLTLLPLSNIFVKKLTNSESIFRNTRTVNRGETSSAVIASSHYKQKIKVLIHELIDIQCL